MRWHAESCSAQVVPSPVIIIPCVRLPLAVVAQLLDNRFLNELALNIPSNIPRNRLLVFFLRLFCQQFLLINHILEEN